MLAHVLLQSILNTLENGVCIVAPDGRLRALNDSAARLLGFEIGELAGMTVSEAFAPTPERVAVSLGEFLASGKIRQEEICEFRRRNRTPVAVSCTLDRIRLDEEEDGILLRFSPASDALSCDVALHESEIKLRAILDTIVDGVVAADSKGTIQLFNPAAEKLFGYSRDEVTGRNLNMLMPSPDHEAHDGYLANYLRTGVKKIIGIGREVTGKRKDGSRFPLYLSVGEALLGRERIFVGVLHDLTAQKQEKKALQESEERFRQVAEMTGEWLWEQDPAGRYIYSSGAVREVLGYQPEEILGMTYLDLLTIQDRERWSHLSSTDSHHRFTRLSNRYLHRDGHEVFTESTGEPIFDAAGRLVKWRGVDHNVTHRKLYEDALRLRDRAIEAASVGIVIADARDPAQPNIYINPALSRITGYSREELLGSNLRILQGLDTDPAAVREIVDAMRTGQGCEVVLKNYRKDGTPFWNELRISPVRDDGGALTHFIGVQTDVTELRRASEERHELEIAKQIQLSLLPKRPLAVEGAKVAGLCLPATHIGGDYFDYFYTGRSLDVVIADVSGHSVGAALIMAEVRSALKAETRLTSTGNNNGPAKVLSLLNEVLYEDLSGSDLFISMFYLRLDLATRRLSYANAGHNCPLLSRASAAVCEPLDADGLILGVRKIVFFEEKSLQIEAGDRLLLYTDGVTEALNEQGEFFDVPRLCDLFATHRDTRPEIVIGQLIEALHAFRGAAPLVDDVSMAVIGMD
ncbi:MAG TPA: PAS domain S-box protein [Methylococcaceae bacterium]|nr:PAS domain S-box protein [Methylococcaceae bacterium]